MITALFLVYALGDKIYLQASINFTQKGRLILPAARGVACVESGNSKKLGRALWAAETLLKDTDADGRLKNESRLQEWPELPVVMTRQSWLAAKCVPVSFYDDGTVNVASSRHGDDVGTYSWQAPFYNLKSPSPKELGTAVLDALAQSK